MVALNKPQIYNSVEQSGMSPRQVEAWGLIEAARRMATSNTLEAPEKEKREAMKAALRLNWKLWTIYQSELSLETSPVPEDIRMNMLTLCGFVREFAAEVDPILKGATGEGDAARGLVLRYKDLRDQRALTMPEIYQHRVRRTLGG